MAGRTVEVSLKLLAEQFKAELRTAESSFAQSMRGMRSEGDRLKHAFAILDVTPIREQEREIRLLQAAYERLRASGVVSGADLSRAQEQLRSKIREVRGEVIGLGTAASKAGGYVAGMFTVAAAARFVGSIIQATNEYQNMQGRLRLVTNGQQELNVLTGKLAGLAQATSSSLGATADLYLKIARNAEQLGLTQQQILTITQAINQSLQLGGASAAEAASSAMQIGQALASGVLQGDELRSVLENNGVLSKAVSDALDLSIGKLRKMGQEGRVTAEVFAGAMLDASAKINKDFASLPDTIERAITRLQNQFLLIFGQTDTSGMTDAINDLTEKLKDPAVQQTLAALAKLVFDLAGAAAWAAGVIGSIGTSLGESLAKDFSGPILDDIQKIDAEIERLQVVLAEPMSILEDNPLDRQLSMDRLKELEQRRAMYADLIKNEKKVEKDAAEQGVQVTKDAAGREVEIRKSASGEIIQVYRTSFSEIQKARDADLAVLKARLQDQVHAEKEAAEKIKSMKKELKDFETELKDQKIQKVIDTGQPIDIKLEAFRTQRAGRNALDEGKTEDALLEAKHLGELSKAIKDKTTQTYLAKEAEDIYREAKTAQIATAEKDLSNQKQENNDLQDVIKKFKEGAKDAGEALASLNTTPVQIQTNIPEIISQAQALRNALVELAKQQGSINIQVPDLPSTPAQPSAGADQTRGPSGAPVTLVMPTGDKVGLLADQNGLDAMQRQVAQGALKMGDYGGL
jgi:tape measure domain-containing protein